MSLEAHNAFICLLIYGYRSGYLVGVKSIMSSRLFLRLRGRMAGLCGCVGVEDQVSSSAAAVSTGFEFAAGSLVSIPDVLAGESASGFRQRRVMLRHGETPELEIEMQIWRRATGGVASP